jgi:hypothetical protein
MYIENKDLYNTQFTYDQLKDNIYNLCLLDIVKTQVLDAEFCIKYILNSDFQLTPEEQKITIHDIKQYQHHISNEEFNIAFRKIHYSKILKNLKRIDSFESFESVIEK